MTGLAMVRVPPALGGHHVGAGPVTVLGERQGPPGCGPRYRCCGPGKLAP